MSVNNSFGRLSEMLQLSMSQRAPSMLRPGVGLRIAGFHRRKKTSRLSTVNEKLMGEMDEKMAAFWHAWTMAIMSKNAFLGFDFCPRSIPAVAVGPDGGPQGAVLDAKRIFALVDRPGGT